MPKTITLNAPHYFIMNIPNKRELQQRALNHSSDTEFKDLIRVDKEYTKETFSSLVNGTNLKSDNALRFRKNLLLNDSS